MSGRDPWAPGWNCWARRQTSRATSERVVAVGGTTRSSAPGCPVEGTRIAASRLGPARRRPRCSDDSEDLDASRLLPESRSRSCVRRCLRAGGEHGTNHRGVSARRSAWSRGRSSGSRRGLAGLAKTSPATDRHAADHAENAAPGLDRRSHRSEYNRRRPGEPRPDKLRSEECETLRSFSSGRTSIISKRLNDTTDMTPVIEHCGGCFSSGRGAPQRLRAATSLSIRRRRVFVDSCCPAAERRRKP